MADQEAIKMIENQQILFSYTSACYHALRFVTEIILGSIIYYLLSKFRFLEESRMRIEENWDEQLQSEENEVVSFSVDDSEIPSAESQLNFLIEMEEMKLRLVRVEDFINSMNEMDITERVLPENKSFSEKSATCAVECEEKCVQTMDVRIYDEETNAKKSENGVRSAVDVKKQSKETVKPSSEINIGISINVKENQNKIDLQASIEELSDDKHQEETAVKSEEKSPEIANDSVKNAPEINISNTRFNAVESKSSEIFKSAGISKSIMDIKEDLEVIKSLTEISEKNTTKPVINTEVYSEEMVKLETMEPIREIHKEILVEKINPKETEDHIEKIETRITVVSKSSEIALPPMCLDEEKIIEEKCEEMIEAPSENMDPKFQMASRDKVLETKQEGEEEERIVAIIKVKDSSEEMLHEEQYNFATQEKGNSVKLHRIKSSEANFNNFLTEEIQQSIIDQAVSIKIGIGSEETNGNNSRAEFEVELSIDMGKEDAEDKSGIIREISETAIRSNLQNKESTSSQKDETRKMISCKNEGRKSPPIRNFLESLEKLEEEIDTTNKRNSENLANEIASKFILQHVSSQKPNKKLKTKKIN